MAADAGNQITAWSIVSLLAGTVISAIVSYLLQRNSFAEARLQKAEERFDQRKTLGLNLFHKMLRIASTLELLKKIMLEAYEKANKGSYDGNAWKYVLPLANLPNHVRFAPEEQTLLMLTDMNLFNDMGPFDEVHNSLIDAFAHYRLRRSELTDTLSAEMKGNVGTTTFTAAEMLKAAPKFAELNMLVDAMLARSQTDSAEAWTLIERLRTSLNNEFKLHLQLEPKEIGQ
jgi:hypothetical protein